MTTRELLEMAHLDALGMLDEQERDAFERAFRAAPDNVQRQVLREQTRLTADDRLLPDVLPEPGLRGRVLLAVREAMRAVAEKETPADVLARLAPAGLSLRRNVSPLWRAACIGFATATVVLMAAGFSLQGEWVRARAAEQDAAFAYWINDKLGAQYADLMTSPNAQRLAFVPAQGVTQGKAAIYFDAESRTAFLMCNDIPVHAGEYRLALIGPDGQINEVATFAYTGGVMARHMEPVVLDQLASPGVSLAILQPRTATPLLVTLGA
jgi:hypothetical protein